MTGWWRRLHGRRWWVRWPTKLGLLATVVLVVLFPRLDRFVTWVGRLRDPMALLSPDEPGLAPLAAEVRERVSANADDAAVRAAVERVVYERIGYAWDWDLWGVVDYLPTVKEVLSAGREDCDGRAVVAASLLRRLGVEAWLASDFLHVWVVTPGGAVMSPTGPSSVVATPRGPVANVNRALLPNFVKGWCYGVAVFPWGREAIIAAAMWLLAWRPGLRRWRWLAGGVLLGTALVVLRLTGVLYAREPAAVTGPLIGGACLAAALLVLLLPTGARGADRAAYSRAAPPG